MVAIVLNISGLFLLLGEELYAVYEDYTLGTNRTEPLTTWAVLVVVTLSLIIKCAHAHSNMMQYYDYC